MYQKMEAFFSKNIRNWYKR